MSVISGTSDKVVAAISVGEGPWGVAYDSATRQVFVANEHSSTVSVIAGASDTVVATVSVGSYPEGVAYDSGTGQVFVADFGAYPNYHGEVSVISTTNDTVAATIGVGTGPQYVAYDSGTGQVFVTNGRSNNVSVISDTTDKVVATVDVGSDPLGAAYDSGTAQVFVTNLESNNVSVISDATDTVVATVGVGSDPDGATYDSGTGQVFVANSDSNNVSVISDAIETVVANVSVGSGPLAAAYDGRTGQVFIADWGSDTVSVISGATDTVTGTVSLASYPDGVAYDPGTGQDFVANYASSTVSTVSEATDTVVATVSVGLNPVGVAYDGGTGQVFVANWGSDNVSVISDANDTVVATVSVGSNPEAAAYDSGTGQVFVANARSGTVSVISDTNDTVVATVSVGSDPEAVAYDSGTGQVFVANGLSNNVSLISGTTDTVVATIDMGSYPDGVAYDSGTGQVFVANALSDNVSVISGATDRVVATVRVGSEPSALAYDSGTDQVYVANELSDNVSVISDASDKVVGTVSVGSSPEAATYDSGTGQVLVANTPQGTLSVLSEGYVLTVAEKGLPEGTTWHFAVNAAGAGVPDYHITANNTTVKGGSAIFHLGTGNITLDAQQYYNGFYGGFDNATLAGLSVLSVTGSGVNYPYANVSGGPLTMTVTFGSNETVNLTGMVRTDPDLSGGTSFEANLTWSVTLTPTTKGTVELPTTVDVTDVGLDGTASFGLPKGEAFKYTVTPPAYYKSSPSSGAGTAASTRTIDVYFSMVPGRVWFPVTGLPPGTEVGVNITCAASCGRTAPVSISWYVQGAYENAVVGTVLPSGTYTVQWWAEADFSRYAATEINVSAPHTLVVRAAYDQGRVTFAETGLAHGSEWGVNITGPVGFSLTGASASMTQALEDGTYTVQYWNVMDHSLYATTEINVSARTAQTVHVAYDQARTTFTEVGLARGTDWGVNVSGPVSLMETSTGTSIPLDLEDGTYTVTYWNENDYTLRVATEINVTGRTAIAVHGTYDQARVIFVESGLRAGTVWGVNVSGPVSFQETSTGTSIVIPLEDGSYTVQYWSVEGYTITNGPSPSLLVMLTSWQTVHIDYHS